MSIGGFSWFLHRVWLMVEKHCADPSESSKLSAPYLFRQFLIVKACEAHDTISHRVEVNCSR